MISEKTHCQCSEVYGEPCRAVAMHYEMREVDWMPEHLRQNHVNANNHGTYPHNGAIRLMLAPACADQLLADDPDWTVEVVK